MNHQYVFNRLLQMIRTCSQQKILMMLHKTLLPLPMLLHRLLRNTLLFWNNVWHLLKVNSNV